MSEKRLVRARGQALRSPNTGLTVPRRAGRALPRFALTHRLFFSGRSWDYINIRSPHNAQFLNTYRSVRLHSSFTCMGSRIDYFSSGSSMETHRLLFFGPELGLYQQSLASQRSILEHVSICSPSQFVHLHGKPYRLFFERELDGNAPISVRVIATIGITHGRKTVSPSRNPCDPDPFLVATQNRCSPSWDPH